MCKYSQTGIVIEKSSATKMNAAIIIIERAKSANKLPKKKYARHNKKSGGLAKTTVDASTQIVCFFHPAKCCAN